MERKPAWLKGEYNKEIVDEMNGMLAGLHLNTVCNEAACPNRGECYRKRTATFMILGANCTRRCRFCNVTQSEPQCVDPMEPENILQAVKRLGLFHVVITSVTRDDLPDGGAAHFAKVTRAILDNLPTTTVELLIPDLQGDAAALDVVLNAGPQIFSHNLETVPRLYETVRPQANYARSLGVLAYGKQRTPAQITKTGIMLGLSETEEELLRLFGDVASVGVDIFTMGQYLRPSEKHIAVSEYVHPDTFARYGELAKQAGIPYVYSAPLVRSSYNAADAFSFIRSLRVPD